MASKKRCYLSFDKAIEAIKGSLTIEKLSQKYRKKLGEAGLKPWMEQQIQGKMDIMEEELKSIIKSQKALGNSQEVATMTKEAMRRHIIDITSDLKAAVRVVDYVNNHSKGLKTKQEFLNVLGRYSQEGYTAIEAERLTINRMMDDLLDTLSTQGARANPEVDKQVKEFFLNHVGGKDDLLIHLRDNGIADPQRELFIALAQGTHDIPVLDRIGSVFKVFDQKAYARAQKFAPYDIKRIKDHTVSLKPNYRRLHDAGIDALTEWDGLREALDWKRILGLPENQITREAQDKWYREYFKERTEAPPIAGGDFKTAKSAYSQRALMFEMDASKDIQYEFMKRFGDEDFDPLRDAIRHRQGLGTANVMYNMYGSDMNFNFTVMREMLVSKGKKHGIADTAFNRAIDEDTEFLRAMGGMKDGDDVTIANYYRGAKNTVSATLVTAAAARDIGYDQTLNAALNRRLLTGEGSILDGLQNVKDVLTKAWELGSDNVQEAMNIIESMGHANRRSHHHLLSGMEQQMNFAAGSKGSAKFVEWTEKLSTSVSQLTLADRLLTAAKLNAVSNATDMVFGTLHGKFPKGKIMEFFREHGFTDAEVEVFRKLKPLDLPDGSKVFDYMDIMRLKDSEIEGARRGLESGDDIRKRMFYGFKDIVTKIAETQSADVTMRGRPMGQFKNPHVQGLLGSVTQFLNINFSQYFNTLESITRAAGHNPNIIGGHWNFNMMKAAMVNPKAAFEFLSTSAAVGIMYLWFTDLRNGRTPRDLSPETMYDAITFAGAGGFAQFLVNNLRYNGAAMASPTNAIIRPMKQLGTAAASGDEKRMKHAGYNVIKRLPYMDMWWISLAREKALREAGLEPGPGHKRIMKERGQQEFIE